MIKKILPKSIYKIIVEVYIQIFRRKILTARKYYKYSDEYLKMAHITEAMNYLRVAGNNGVIPETYFEFGCHSGRTFSAAVNAGTLFKMIESKYFAFDSFQGLPETDEKVDGIFKKGTFKTSRKDFINTVKKNTGVEIPRSNIIEGYYDATLTTDLQASMPGVGIAYIDVDLYSSTVEVLEFLKPLLVKGSVLMFDDWYCFPAGKEMGEARAFKEFCKKYPMFEYEEWKVYSTFGKSFFVINTP